MAETWVNTILKWIAIFIFVYFAPWMIFESWSIWQRFHDPKDETKFILIQIWRVFKRTIAYVCRKISKFIITKLEQNKKFCTRETDSSEDFEISPTEPAQIIEPLSDYERYDYFTIRDKTDFEKSNPFYIGDRTPNWSSTFGQKSFDELFNCFSQLEGKTEHTIINMDIFGGKN